MAIRARLVFPGIAPVGASTDDNEWRVGNGRLGGGRFDQHSAAITSAQPAQTKVGGSKVIQPSFEVGQGAASEIEFDFVERTGTSRCAEIKLATGIGAAARNPCRKIEQLADRVKIRDSIIRMGSFRDGGNRRDAARLDLTRKRQGIEPGIYFEGKWLVDPVQEVRICADA